MKKASIRDCNSNRTGGTRNLNKAKSGEGSRSNQNVCTIHNTSVHINRRPW